MNHVVNFSGAIFFMSKIELKHKFRMKFEFKSTSDNPTIAT